MPQLLAVPPDESADTCPSCGADDTASVLDEDDFTTSARCLGCGYIYWRTERADAPPPR